MKCHFSIVKKSSNFETPVNNSLLFYMTVVTPFTLLQCVCLLELCQNLEQTFEILETHTHTLANNRQHPNSSHQGPNTSSCHFLPKQNKQKHPLELGWVAGASSDQKVTIYYGHKISYRTIYLQHNFCWQETVLKLPEIISFVTTNKTQK